MSKKPSAYAAVAGLMNMDGLEGLLAPVAGQATFGYVALSDIKILPQQRDSDDIEDDEQSLADMAENTKELGVLQPIIICNNATGGAERYRLVAGERRWHSARLAGLPTIPSMIYGDLTEEKIDKIQYSENTHRKNLSLLNEARVLQKDIEALGSIEAVCEKRNKPRSWVSKRLQLLELPEQARALFVEGVTSDLETIAMVRQIEQIDQEAGRAVAQEIRETVESGGNVRKTAKAAKDKVKPPKKTAPVSVPAPAGHEPESGSSSSDMSAFFPTLPQEGQDEGQEPAWSASVLEEQNQPRAEDLEQQQEQEPEQQLEPEQDQEQQPEPEQQQQDQEQQQEPAGAPESVATAAEYDPQAGREIVDKILRQEAHNANSSLLDLLDQIAQADIDAATLWLELFHSEGAEHRSGVVGAAGVAVYRIRNSQFAGHGAGAAAMAAYVAGLQGWQFDFLNSLEIASQ